MTDVITMKAAEVFAVPIEQVTPEMRSVVKLWRHGENYSMGGIKAGKILGQYPVKQEPF